MIGGGRHMASRRRGSSPMIRLNLELPHADGSPKTGVSPRRRRAVAVADHKSCALIQTRLKLGELVWVAMLFFGIYFFHLLNMGNFLLKRVRFLSFSDFKVCRKFMFRKTRVKWESKQEFKILLYFWLLMLFHNWSSLLYQRPIAWMSLI